MTKKDYELIASALNNTYLGHKEWVRTLEQIAGTLADTLAEHNPKFNRNKFLTACGIQPLPAEKE